MLGLVRAGLHPRALGHHDDGEGAPTGVAALDVLGHAVEVRRDLRHQDDVRAACDARVGGDPPHVPPHHLADDDALVALRRGVQPVDGVRGDHHRGVEAEGEVGGVDVVVDGLGHADDRQALLVHARGGRERPLAADGDDGADAVALHRALHPLQAVLHLEGVDAAGAEDGAAAVQDAARRLAGEPEVVILQQALPPVAQAHHLEAVLRAPAHHGANDGIESRAIPSTGEHGYFHMRTGYARTRSPAAAFRRPALAMRR